MTRCGGLQEEDSTGEEGEDILLTICLPLQARTKSVCWDVLFLQHECELRGLASLRYLRRVYSRKRIKSDWRDYENENYVDKTEMSGLCYYMVTFL